MFLPMQRDFQINSLRTKTKYKLTSLRLGMKNHILESLKQVFGEELQDIPMLSVLEAMESKKLRRENSNANDHKKIKDNKNEYSNTRELKKETLIEAKEINHTEEQENKINIKENKFEEVPTEEKGTGFKKDNLNIQEPQNANLEEEPKSADLKKKIIKPKKSLNKKEEGAMISDQIKKIERKNKSISSSNSYLMKTEETGLLEALGVSKKLPGLRRYGKMEDSSILSEDSLFERKGRKKSSEGSKTRIKKSESNKVNLQE